MGQLLGRSSGQQSKSPMGLSHFGLLKRAEIALNLDPVENSVMAREAALQQALQDSQLAVTLCPSYPFSYLILAKVAIRLGKWDVAVEAASQCVEVKPDLYTAYYLLAEAYEASDEYEAAAAARARVPKNIRPQLQATYAQYRAAGHFTSIVTELEPCPISTGGSCGGKSPLEGGLRRKSVDNGRDASIGLSVPSHSEEDDDTELGDIDASEAAADSEKKTVNCSHATISMRPADTTSTLSTATQVPAPFRRAVVPKVGAYMGFEPRLGHRRLREAIVEGETTSYENSDDAAIRRMLQRREEEFREALIHDQNIRDFRQGRRGKYVQTPVTKEKIRRIGEQRTKFNRLVAESLRASSSK